MDGSTMAAVKCRLFYVDSNPLVRSAIQALALAEEDLAIVGTSDLGADLLAADESEFDVAIIAWDMSDMKAPDLLRRLKARHSTVKTVIFCNTRDTSALRLAVRLGVHGFCFQHDKPSVLFNAIRLVAGGNICVPFIDFSKINETPLAGLTVRERELLDVLARGWTNQQIANRTGISENTVKYHLKNLYQKLDVQNRARAVAIWSREVDA